MQPGLCTRTRWCLSLSLEMASELLMVTELLGAGWGSCFAEPAQGSSYRKRCGRRMTWVEVTSGDT